MSAYVVEDQTINRIVLFIRALQFNNQGPLCMLKSPFPSIKDNGLKALGQQLFDMNEDAIMSRYGEKTQESYTFRSVDYSDPWQVLKSLDCYLYQCSEGDIPETNLFKMLERFRNDLTQALVRSTKKYQAACWG